MLRKVVIDGRLIIAYCMCGFTFNIHSLDTNAVCPAEAAKAICDQCGECVVKQSDAAILFNVEMTLVEAFRDSKIPILVKPRNDKRRYY